MRAVMSNHMTLPRKFGIGHHRLDFSSQSSFGGVRFLSHATKLCVRFVDEDDNFVECFEHASQSFEDDIRLAKPLTTDALEDQALGTPEFTCDGFEQERLSATDRARRQLRPARPCPVPL